MGGENDGPEPPPRRGPASDMGRPISPGPMMGPGPGRPPIVVPIAGIPSGIPPGAPAPHLPPGPILGGPQPFMLPPPPQGYFRDWDRFGGWCCVDLLDFWLIWFINQRTLYSHELSVMRHHPALALASALVSVHTSPWHMIRHRNFIFGTHMHICPPHMHIKYLVILTCSF